jgi:hypothetical protein
MSDDNMDLDNDTTTTETPAKTFTQDELDRIVADRIARENRKFEKRISGIDLDEARDLLSAKEKADEERQKERGDFDAILKATVEKKDAVIGGYKDKLQQTLVDGALLSAASQNNAVSPEQVSTLLKNNTRLADDGGVEVLDGKGVPRYNDSGELLSVNDMVTEFLTANPHFVKASQGGTGSQGNAGGSTQKPQSVADMVANWDNGGKQAFAALKKK